MARSITITNRMNVKHPSIKPDYGRGASMVATANRIAIEARKGKRADAAKAREAYRRACGLTEDTTERE